MTWVRVRGNTAEGQANGTVVADPPANTGGGSGDAFDSITNYFDPKPTFSTDWSDGGTRSYKFTNASSQVISWESIDPITTCRIGLSYKFAVGAIPDADTVTLIFAFDGAFGTACVFFDTNGKLCIGPDYTIAQATSTGTYGIDGSTDARVEFDIDTTTQDMVLRIYTPASSSTPSETLGANLNDEELPIAAITRVDYGANSIGQPLDTYYFDDLFIDVGYGLTQGTIHGQTLVCEGFEHGYLPTSPVDGIGLTFAHDNATVQDVHAKHGNWAARIAPVADYGWIEFWADQRDLPEDPGTALASSVPASPIIDVWSLYFRFDELPDSDCYLFYEGDSGVGATTFGIGFNSATGALRAFHVSAAFAVGDAPIWGDDGFIPESGTWYRLDMSIASSNSPYTEVLWRIDGAVQPSLSDSSVGSYGELRRVWIGNRDDSADIPNNPDPTTTMVLHVDDIVVVRHDQGWTGDYPNYPIGDHEVSLLYPIHNGTHATASAFTDDDAASPPADAVAKIDDYIEDALTDTYVFQDTNNAGAYLEFLHSYLPQSADNHIFAAQTRVTLTGSAAGSADLGVHLYIDAAERYALINLETTFGGTAKQWFGGSPLTGMARSDVTLNAINESTFRVGYAADVSPEIRVQSVSMQVAHGLHDTQTVRIDQLLTGEV